VLHTTARVAVVLGCLFTVPGLARAQDPTQPHATVGAQAVTFQPPLALYDAASNSVKLLYATKALSAKDEADARRDRSWPFEGLGPVVKVDMQFAPGTFSGAMNEVLTCWIGLFGFRGAPIEISGNPKDCHLISTGGRLLPGGMLIGLLEGKGKGYDLRLPFTAMFPAATISAAPAAAAAAPAPSAPAGPPIPPNTAAGTGTYAGQTLTFTHGLAWVNKDKYEVALFDHAPPAGILAELKTGSWGEGGPKASLTFMVEAGKSGPDAISYCYVNLDFPKGGPMGLNVNSAAKCGLTEIGGTLAPGGAIIARLKGSAPMRDAIPMGWDLRFNLPLAK